MKTPNFYALIIGTEILNGRREDKHFPFLREELLRRGFTLKASMIIEDDPSLMESVYSLIKDDPHSVLFSFGGIGATPDDYTRMVAAKVFGDGKLYEHPEAKRRIIDQFKEDAYPYRINMAKLPIGANLLDNPINNVPGFYLQNRFFFVPGFPQMAHPMVRQALDLFFPKNSKKFRYTVCIKASENDLLDIMKKIPKELEFSSLPSIKNGQYMDVLSIASYDKEVAKEWFDYIIHEVEKRGFSYKVDNCR
ncbi:MULTISPECIES: molybdopterin-binding protein [unclassified Nitratiruptor]|uniref:competence/damage-inducible protein A n=1 Tax=unclassified Nitratiruptor TaxID=2624044 RepID=UPI001915AF5A|nr:MULTISPECIES: molybdopterin-binding protein [unclassified Nitratiruptor]BCD60511.1 molybdenum cofactor biosynthesis protein MoaB [Nitratiruptor sp. YY08-10]BCD64000.1 molybdenum cofactor biosynthesis protein MoaB [Nitratiruptor sp. YY08-14]